MTQGKKKVGIGFEIGDEFAIGPLFRSLSRGNAWRGTNKDEYLESRAVYLVKITRKFMFFSLNKNDKEGEFKVLREDVEKKQFPILQLDDFNMGIYIYENASHFNLAQDAYFAKRKVDEWLSSNSKSSKERDEILLEFAAILDKHEENKKKTI